MNSAQKISDALDLLPEATLEESELQPKKKTFRRYRPLAAAACLCAAFLGLMLYGIMQPGAENAFAVKAYAMELEEDGSVQLVETDLLDQPDVWGAAVMDGTVYVSLGLRFSGENIRKVEFTTDNGFFASQDTTGLVIGDGTPCTFTGEDNRLVMAGDSFKNEGPRLSFDGPAMPEGLLLFWAVPGDSMAALPESIDVLATATFTDGSTQEISLNLQTENQMIVYSLPPGALDGIVQPLPLPDWLENGEAPASGASGSLETRAVPENADTGSLPPEWQDVIQGWNSSPGTSEAPETQQGPD